MLHELLSIAMDAFYYGKEGAIIRRQQNECLLANICEAKYDLTTHAWMVIPRKEFIQNGKTYKIKECLCANTCHYDIYIKDYVLRPGPQNTYVKCDPTKYTSK